MKEFLEKTPGARIFVTRRPHIRTGIGTSLAGRVTFAPGGPTRDEIIRLLRARLSGGETPNAMDSSLEADILEKIPENASEIWAGP